MESVRPPMLPARVSSLMTVDVGVTGEARTSTKTKNTTT